MACPKRAQSAGVVKTSTAPRTRMLALAPFLFPHHWLGCGRSPLVQAGEQLFHQPSLHGPLFNNGCSSKCFVSSPMEDAKEQEREQFNLLAELPAELLFHVLQFLSPTQLLGLRLVGPPLPPSLALLCLVFKGALACVVSVTPNRAAVGCMRCVETTTCGDSSSPAAGRRHAIAAAVRASGRVPAAGHPRWGAGDAPTSEWHGWPSAGPSC